MTRLLVVALALLSSTALAEVGKVEGVDLWEQAAIDAASRNDACSKWFEKNR